MQKHKKYLMIIAWINAIAFIAAGMVGWGAYNYSSSSGAVARVGSVNIKPDELNLEYQNITRNYEQRTNTTLDAEKAKELGIEDIALQTLINRAMLENFALDSGLRVSDDEVSAEIQKIESFRENGVFSANLYKEILSQNRIKPSDFEARLRKDLLVGKILALIPNIITPLENDVFSAAFGLQDRLSIQIIPASAVKVEISDADLQKFYEENKENYKSQKAYEIEFFAHSIDEISPSEADLAQYYEQNIQNYTQSGERMALDSIKDRVTRDYKDWRAKRSALESSIAMRDSKQKGESLKITAESHPAIVTGIEAAKGRIEPILDNGAYYAVKVIAEIPQEILPFESVKNAVRADFYPNALRSALEKEAFARQKLFAGRDIGFFGIDYSKTIPGLNALESQLFLTELFSRSDRNGFVLLDDKAVLFHILEQKLLQTNASNLIFSELKGNVLEQSILEFLAKKYKVINNLRG